MMGNHFSSSVYYDGQLYGADRTIFRCLHPDDGRSCWEARGFGEGSVIAAAGHLYVLGTSGRLALVLATPEAFVEKGSVPVLRGRSYTPPSLADGVLYLRNGTEMVALDVRSGQAGGNGR
jgi:hypothetical protein